MGASLPTTGYLRLHSIIGDTKKGITGVFPVSRSAWYQGIRDGKYPKPINLGGSRSTAWKVEDIKALLEQQA